MNALVGHAHNFYDEELVDIYVAFLKSLALQLTPQTASLFVNAKARHFPLMAAAVRFFNHPEMMVRNAVRVIALTVFKLNDEAANEALGDLPVGGYFAQLACHLRDKVLDVDQSQQGRHGQVGPAAEELQDLLEYLQEVFECGNRPAAELLANALLFYCYFPVVLGSLAAETKPIISISTAQFVLIRTFHVCRFQPLVNSIVAALLLDRVPPAFLEAVDKYPDRDPATYSFKWRLRQPGQVTLRQCKRDLMMFVDCLEYLNASSFDALVDASP